MTPQRVSGSGLLLLRLFLLARHSSGNTVCESILDIVHRRCGPINATPSERFLKLELPDEGVFGHLVNSYRAINVDLA